MTDFRIELRWAIIFSFVTMIWMFIEFHLGWHDRYINNQLRNHFILTPLIYGLIYYIAIKAKREKYYKGVITWKQALFSGGTLSVLVALISPISEFFIYNYITPEYFNNMIAYQTEQGLMTEESATSFFNMKSFLIQGVFNSLTFGFFVSIIIAFIVRRKPEEEQK